MLSLQAAPIKTRLSIFEFEINLVDKNTNSLKQLNQYINTMYKIQAEKKKKYMDYDNSADTIAAPPGVDLKPVN